MDNNDDIELKLVQFKQAIKESKQHISGFAELTKDYFDALVRSGFSENNAIILTSSYMTTIMTGGK